MMTERFFSTIVCGIIGEVYLGDGNEKNCCNNSKVFYFMAMYKIFIRVIFVYIFVSLLIPIFYLATDISPLNSEIT